MWQAIVEEEALITLARLFQHDSTWARAGEELGPHVWAAFSSEICAPFSQVVDPFPGHAGPIFRANGSMELELCGFRAHSHVEDNVVHRVKSRQLLFGGSCPCDEVPLAQVGLWECLGPRTFLSCPTKVKLGDLGEPEVPPRDFQILSGKRKWPSVAGWRRPEVTRAVGHGAQ